MPVGLNVSLGPGVRYLYLVGTTHMGVGQGTLVGIHTTPLVYTIDPILHIRSFLLVPFEGACCYRIFQVPFSFEAMRH